MSDARVVEQRHRAILDIARQTGRVEVEQLAAILDVTPQTVRKDLNILADRLMLSRVHGGAVIASGVDNLIYDQRRKLAAEAKAAIGAAAAMLVPAGASLFINIGTTTEAVARNLVHHEKLMVISNNLNVIDILASRPTIDVCVVGGRIRSQDRAVIGTLAASFIENFRVDYAFIGASGLDSRGNLLDFDVDEVEVSRIIIRNARKVILVADASKIGRPAPVKIAGLEDIDFLVTDHLPDAALRDACAQAAVSVIETGLNLP